MKVDSIQRLVQALHDAGVPFIVVGGLAVVAHGYGRTTNDVDLVIRLDPKSILSAFRALATLGYTPRVPVTAEGFADPEQRARWIAEKGMVVLTFHSEHHQDTPVDVFVTEPFDFQTEYDAALSAELSTGLNVRIVRLQTLLKMKQSAGRAQDLADIEELRLLHEGDARD